MKTYAALAGLLILANLALSQGESPGLAPSLRLVGKVDHAKGVFTTVDTVQIPTMVEKQIDILINGQAVKQTVRETIMRPLGQITKWTIKPGRFIGTDGKDVPAEELPKRLRANTVIGVSNDGNAPGRVFLRALHPECLIFLPPPQKALALPKSLPKT